MASSSPSDSKESESKTSDKDKSDVPRESTGAGSRALDDPKFPSPFDFSAMSGLLNDPTIKDLAEQIAMDPAFTNMAEQLQRSVQVAGQDGIPQLDTQQYFNAMQQVVQNPQFMTMAEKLGSALMQDPAMAGMLENLTNPERKEQLESKMTQIRSDPKLKPILEEIETGGPAAMMKYWNDPEVLSKLGEAMGFALPGATSFTDEAADARDGDEGCDEDEVEELTVHHASSVGDVEVWVLLN